MSAKSAAEEATSGAVAQYLTFSLGEDIFAMDIATVREIIQYGPMTAVPLMPAFVRGVINLRGAVVPVIDLQVRFGRPAARVGKKTCIIIFNALRDGERVELGLIVDAVSEVVDIASDHIQLPPHFGTAIKREFIRGIGKVAGRFVILVDPDRAFNMAEMAALCEASQECAGG